MNLYRIKLKGMQSNVSSTKYGIPYVVAESPNQAIDKVLDYLNERDIGFRSDRVLESIEMLAEEGDYPYCKIQLFL